ncbi:MAG: cell division protein ZapA [Candidatus Zixiibacteriota bacterium]|nr:MAG: cell division protein ZapA [candidate division Zixibacteria bacterium]
MADISVEDKVIVRIFGEDYPIAANGNAAYISKVADFVDSRMRAVSRRSRSQARDKVAILAAMSIASELVEKRDSLSAAESLIASDFDQLLARLDGVIDDN